jgi:hypothetical protein
MGFSFNELRVAGPAIASARHRGATARSRVKDWTGSPAR